MRDEPTDVSLGIRPGECLQKLARRPGSIRSELHENGGNDLTGILLSYGHGETPHEPDKSLRRDRLPEDSFLWRYGEQEPVLAAGRKD